MAITHSTVKAAYPTPPFRLFATDWNDDHVIDDLTIEIEKLSQAVQDLITGALQTSTFNEYIDQAVKTTSSPSFNNLALDGWAWIKGRNYLFANPADPATPAYGMSTYKMMGLGSVLSFTPKFSGKLKIEVSMGCRHTTLNATVVQLAYGTGDPPANQAAATGTVFGPDLIRMTWADVMQVPTVASDATWIWILDELEVDTPYWFDAQVKQIGTGDGKASIHDIMVYIEEI